jgi:histidine triad (HIT) family protein
MPTLFSRIITGELPSYRIHEDELTYSFLARDAIQPGHTLVVPKIEVDHFLDVPEPYYSAVFANARTIGRAIQAATACRRVGTLIAGWDVPHFHYHVVPMWDPTDLRFDKARVLQDAQYRSIQQKIVEALG